MKNNKFIYANGNGYILGIVQQLLKNTQEIIVVFLDFYPTNDSIVRIYKNMRYESRKNNNRVIFSIY